MRRIYDLRRYGLPETLLDIWVQQQGELLLPVQEAAVQRYGLFDGRSLVISSPTSSGKTFVGELAAMRAAFAGKRVLYLTPLRALAEEKFHTFRTRYGAYGIKVVVATRDRREFDHDIEQGDFHLAVLVYEKLAQLLVRQPHLLRAVALVVVDELQMLGDPDRGPGRELSLALGWSAGEEMVDLEQHYQCYAGTIKTQMAHLSWLADAAAEVASVMGWAPTHRLSDLAERLRLGMDAAGLAVARAVPAARQEAIKALPTAGMTTSSPE